MENKCFLNLFNHGTPPPPHTHTFFLNPHLRVSFSLTLERGNEKERNTDVRQKHLLVASSTRGSNPRPFGAPDDALTNCAAQARAGPPFCTEHPLTFSKAAAFGALELKARGHWACSKNHSCKCFTIENACKQSRQIYSMVFAYQYFVTRFTRFLISPPGKQWGKGSLWSLTPQVISESENSCHH